MDSVRPLFSVIVVTYNSSSTILETLESIKSQTYDNIELIVSDDCSTDDTVSECKNWLSRNESRFISSEVVTSEMNTGVAPNVNRGLRRCHGDWIKVLGGDDLFLPDAISIVADAISPEEDIIVTQYRTFFVRDGKKVLGELHPSEQLSFFYQSGNGVQRELLLTNFIDATIGYFVRRSVLNAVGGYDENYPMFEDVPMFYKLSQSGYRFILLKEPCFLYRIADSITHPSKDKVYNVRFKESSLRFHRDVTNKHIPWWNIVYHQSYWMAVLQYKLIIKFTHNQNNRLAHVIKTVIYYLTIDSYVKMIKGYL